MPTSGSGIASLSAGTTRPPEFDIELGRLRGKMDLVGDLCGRLENRLVPVLRQSAPSAPLDAGKGVSPSTSRGLELRDLSERLAQIANGLESLLGRVEV